MVMFNLEAFPFEHYINVRLECRRCCKCSDAVSGVVVEHCCQLLEGLSADRGRKTKTRRG
jgi:hypothetical protein